MEDEGVEDLVLGLAEFGWCGRLGFEAFDLGEESLGRGNCGGALGCSFDDEDTGVVVGGAEVAFDGVGEAEFGAQLLEDA